MCHDSFRPTRSELVDTCECCGEELEFGHCVTMSCAVYLAEMGDLYSPIRDVREWADEENPAPKLKETA
jgi:hypothetical protein